MSSHIVVAMNWLLLHAEIQFEESPAIASPCKLQSVTSDPIAGVINVYEKCHVLCCRDLCHACYYSKPSPVLWQDSGPFDL